MPAQEISPVQEISNTLISMKPDFAKMLERTGINPEKFTCVAIMSIQQKPELLQCTKSSLYKAFSDCARDGLLPDGSEAAIVKFGNEAVFMPMVEGILKLFRNSGECGAVDAAVVFSKDEYDSWVDSAGPHFKHKKSREKDRGKPILAYSYAITKDNHLYFEEVSEEDIMAIRNIAKTKMVWDGPFKYEMWRKSALRRLAKRLPKSTDIAMAIEADDATYDLEPEKPQPAQEQTTSSRLSTAIEAQIEKPAPTPPPAPPQTEWEKEDRKAPTDAPEPPKEGQQAPKTARGTISNLKLTQSQPGAAKFWKRFGCYVDGHWYGTFDEKIYDQMSQFSKQGIPVEIVYTEVVNANKIFFECKSIRSATAPEPASMSSAVKEGMPF